MSPYGSAGVILQHGTHYYLLRRSETSRHWPLYWGFPGGKWEAGETIFETAQRELLEETGVHIDEIDIVKRINIHARYIDSDRHYTLFLVNTWVGSPENLERDIHIDDGWFTLDEFPSPMLPHIRAGFDAIGSGVREIEYDGRGEIFE